MRSAGTMTAEPSARAVMPEITRPSVRETEGQPLVRLSTEAVGDLETLQKHPVKEWTPPRPKPTPAPAPQAEEEYEPAYYD